jgi:hypothetical protein
MTYIRKSRRGTISVGVLSAMRCLYAAYMKTDTTPSVSDGGLDR